MWICLLHLKCFHFDFDGFRKSSLSKLSRGSSQHAQYNNISVPKCPIFSYV